MTTEVRMADLGGWQRKVHLEEVWGTVVTFDVRGEQLDASIDDVIAEAVAFLHQVDYWFSTYRVDSPITALRNGMRSYDEMPEVVQRVLDACLYIRELTEGVFDPWAVEGGVDPSGFVKGWAADVAADIFVAAGFPNVSVNAAGDVANRGFQSPNQPWVVGIRHPEHELEVVRTVESLNGAVATSGEYERGPHIRNPHTGTADVKLTSATVVGPDGGMADALATALVIAGTDGVKWFAGMDEWSAYLIVDGNAHFFGPAFESRVEVATS